MIFFTLKIEPIYARIGISWCERSNLQDDDSISIVASEDLRHYF
jgi:hypothetical protein